MHRRFGPGLKETVYEDATAIELAFLNLRFERQKQIVLRYRDRPLRPQRIDLIVEDQLILEIKAVDRLLKLHKHQMISYLRSTGLRVGLLVNFNSLVLKDGIRRIIV